MLVLVFMCTLAAQVSAQESVQGEQADFSFALLRYQSHWNPRPGWSATFGMGDSSSGPEPRYRCCSPNDPTEMADYPLLVWQGDATFPPLDNGAINHLRQHLSMGGTMLIDISDAQVDGPFHSAIKREMRRIFPERTWKRIPEHVLYKSFYLLDRHEGAGLRHNPFSKPS
ncbi:MAG: DUF4159 domain-containing protein [Myxococcota bacterium]